MFAFVVAVTTAALTQAPAQPPQSFRAQVLAAPIVARVQVLENDQMSVVRAFKGSASQGQLVSYVLSTAFDAERTLLQGKFNLFYQPLPGPKNEAVVLASSTGDDTKWQVNRVVKASDSLMRMYVQGAGQKDEVAAAALFTTLANALLKPSSENALAAGVMFDDWKELCHRRPKKLPQFEAQTMKLAKRREIPSREAFWLATFMKPKSRKLFARNVMAAKAFEEKEEASHRPSGTPAPAAPAETTDYGELAYWSKNLIDPAETFVCDPLAAPDQPVTWNEVEASLKKFAK
jgi:hypothetical protein